MKKTLIMTLIMALTVGLANAQEKTADEIARDGGMKLSISPVVPNPFAR
jgi:hypothetical protein